MDIITGMHRSGTSLVARLFFDAGCDMGDAASFYPGDKWNPDGYYEQPDIHAVNMPLINGPWGRLAYFWLPSSRTIKRRAANRAEQIGHASDKYRDKLVKENRFCLTLPAWRAHGAEVGRILVCLRDPVAVARSLRKRNRIPLRLGYRLWLEHNRRLLESAGDIPVWFLYYGNLMAQDRFEDEIVSAFRFMNVGVSARDIRVIAENAIKTHWNHTPGVEATYPSNVEALWQLLRQRHADQFVTSPVNSSDSR